MPPNPASSKAPKSEYVVTDTGNKVSRRSQLHGTQHITLAGRTTVCADVCIRGDLVPQRSSRSTQDPSSKGPGEKQQPPPNIVSVAIGRYTYVSAGAIIRPPHRLSRETISYHPLRIHDHVFIGAGAIVEAALIESHVWVGAGAVLGKFAILKEGCKVLDGAVVPTGMVVASGFVVGGKPASVLGTLGEGWGMGEWDKDTGMGEGGDLRDLWRSVG